MTFVLSKLVWALIQPSNMLVLMLLAGIAARWVGWRRLGGLLTFTAVGVLTVVAVLPIGDLVARPLESRFPTRPLPPTVDGIVVLGGSVSESLSVEHDQPALNHRAERLTTAVRLARTYPAARLVFSGGSGALLGAPTSEAAVAAQFFAELGLDPDRFTLESQSRNTFENAVFTKTLVKPQADETWLLVTSALHMPRSVGVFRKVGWPVIPVPVDFNASARLRPELWASGHLQDLDWAVREWVGLLAYRLFGRTDALFPEPAS